MDSSALVCYIRWAGRPWERASPSTARLLALYEDMRPHRGREPLTLCTTEQDGSLLMARVQPKPHMAGVYLCQMEGSEHVFELMRGPRALGGDGTMGA